MKTYWVTQQARDTVEVEADSEEEAKEMVEHQGADAFPSYHHQSEVIDVQEAGK